MIPMWEITGQERQTKTEEDLSGDLKQLDNKQ